MKRVVLNVSTGRYVIGQARLRSQIADADFLAWTEEMPPASPSHQDTPFAFKTFALAEARRRGYHLALWADSSILPTGPLPELWAHIEREGYWFPNNGWNTGQWCAEAALAPLGIGREESFGIPHLAATAMGFNLHNTRTLQFVYLWLDHARDGRAFRGPVRNDGGEASPDARVLGHRWDQTVASVLAWRLGMTFTDPPKFFAYKGGETAQTLLVADGAY
jgi:hypothetical protein